MDIMVLSPELEPLGIIENYDSLIWTERYLDVGDFEFKGSAIRKNLDLIQPGNFLQIISSDRLMEVREMVNQTHNMEGATMEAKGKSLEAAFNNRDTPRQYSDEGSVPDLVHRLIRASVVEGAPGVHPSNVIPDLVVPEEEGGSPVLDISVDGAPLLKTIQDICSEANYGFRVSHSRLTDTLHVRAYKGQNLPITFSPQTDTLGSPNYLNSIEGHYNVAHVFNDEFEIMTGDLTSRGFRRRVLPVRTSASNITASNYETELRRIGREALASRRRISVFDGEINPNGTYQYRVHYNLGDIVLTEDSLGNSAVARVTEYIWSISPEGIKHYPTFETIT